nr:hypothetical protein [uncultured Roseateles sp.]
MDHHSKAQLAVLMSLALASAASMAQQSETPQAKAVSQVLAEACRPESITGPVPETVWSLIDQKPLTDEFGKGWAVVKKKTVLNGWNGANCWVESHFGDLVLGAALDDAWFDKRPKFTLFNTQTIGGKAVVLPGTISQGAKRNYLSPFQYELGGRVTRTDNDKPSFEEFSTFNYCEARENGAYVQFQPSVTARGKVVSDYWSAFNARGDGYFGTPSFNRYFDFARVVAGLNKALPNWSTLESDFGRPVKGWPMKIVGEAGELVLALQSDEKGDPARYWVFRVVTNYASLQIVPAVNVVGKYLQIYPHVASFQAKQSRDLGKSELELLDSYCKYTRTGLSS